MTEAIAAIVAAVIGSLSGIVVVLISRNKQVAETKKLKAEAEKLEANSIEQLRRTVMQLNEPLRLRVQELEKLIGSQTELLKELNQKLERANKLIRILLRGIAVLMHQLREIGVTPLLVIPVSDNMEIDIDELERRLGVEEERLLREEDI